MDEFEVCMNQDGPGGGVPYATFKEALQVAEDQLSDAACEQGHAGVTSFVTIHGPDWRGPSVKLYDSRWATCRHAKVQPGSSSARPGVPVGRCEDCGQPMEQIGRDWVPY